MNVGVPSVIATMLAIIVIGCTGGNEIAPATSAAAPVPGNGDPLGALYAAPADVAFITVSDVEADIVGPADLPFDAYALLGYSYAAELVPVAADYGPAWGAPFETLDLELAATDAVPPPVDIDAHFAAAIAAVDVPAVVWERGPEMQLEGWEAPPLDAK